MEVSHSFEAHKEGKKKGRALATMRLSRQFPVYDSVLGSKTGRGVIRAGTVVCNTATTRRTEMAMDTATLLRWAPSAVSGPPIEC